MATTIAFSKNHLDSLLSDFNDDLQNLADVKSNFLIVWHFRNRLGKASRIDPEDKRDDKKDQRFGWWGALGELSNIVAKSSSKTPINISFRPEIISDERSCFAAYSFSRKLHSRIRSQQFCLHLLGCRLWSWRR